MSSVTFNGLASGLDTGALIEKLVAAERSAANTLAVRQSDLNTHKSIVGSLSTALASFGALARGMDLGSEVQPRSAVSSDSHISLAASSTAAAGVHDVEVKQLAKAQIVASRTFTSSAAGVLGAGGVTITSGGVSKAVTWTATDSLASIATKITEANAGVTASVLFDGTDYRLVTTATATGAIAPTFVDSGDGLALSDPDNIKAEGLDAKVVIDGIEITRSRNVIDDAIPGVTLTAVSVHGATDPHSTVTVDLDRSALKEKLSALVKAYNAVNAAIHVQLDYTGTAKGTNTLFGDSTLRQLQGALNGVMSNAYGGTTNGTNLGAIGISRDKTGAMTLDETKLTAALAADPRAVENLFVTNGFATAVTTLTDAYSRTGTGILAGKTASITARSKVLQDQIDRINKNADSLQSRLEAQFTALEQAMSTLRNQSSYLSSIL
jgi:flagellar hook-associated protein 2